MVRVRKNVHAVVGMTAGLLACGGLFGPIDAWAADSSELAALKRQVEQLVRQNQALNRRVGELEKKDAEQAQAQTQAQPKTTPPAALAEAGATAADAVTAKNNDYLKLSGIIEADMAVGKGFNGNTATDFTLATAELLLEAQAAPWARGAFGVEWLNGENKISVKETYAILGDSAAMPIGIQAGRYYLPFGLWGGHTISDPLTKQAFRVKGDAVTLIARQAGFYAEAYGYNGATDDGGDSILEHYGFTAGYATKRDDFAFHARVGYISSVFDSVNLKESLAEKQAADTLTENFIFDPSRSYLQADYVGGVALTAQLSVAGFGLYAEYVTAIDDYRMDFVQNGVPGFYESKPSAWNVELSYGFDVGQYPTLVALSGSGTNELGGFLPERQIALFGQLQLIKGLFLRTEYLRDIDYDLGNGGSGDTADSLTFRVTYMF